MNDIEILKEIMRLDYQMDDITNQFMEENCLRDYPSECALEALKKMRELDPILQPLKDRKEELRRLFIQ